MSISIKTRPPKVAVTLERFRIRVDVAERIKRHLMERVASRGMGAFGKLKGYSTQPLRIDQPAAGEKPMRKPAKGWGSFHRKGYKQYRDEIGLVSDKFVFSNKGQAWADWMQATQDPTGPLSFGFADAQNVAAADEAVANGREHMFDVNEQELDTFAEMYLERALDQIWGKQQNP